MKLLTRWARELNWSRRAWSTASDREFHEDLYRGDDYDPFSWAYPGYTTIRRFADLVEPRLPERGLVLDLGCGPGEITCELASRRPDLTFVGIDHSAAAIAKAQANVRRRKVANVRFECRNVEEYAAQGPIDLVTLFDSFHHLTRPAEFVRRLGSHVTRWALIEPRGSWAGTWQKDLDFDWVAQDLDKIRAHVASLCEEPPTVSPFSAPGSSGPVYPPGAAVERRYTLDDLQGFFDGCALDLRGTIAGLETYPPGAGRSGELRERFGELRYQLYRDIDDWLLAHNLDLHAKHWLVVAERAGNGTRARHLDLPALPATSDAPRISGQFDVRYGPYRGPVDGVPAERITGAIELTNDGWELWSSDGPQGIFTSYHWLDSGGHVVEFDGERTPLPRAIAAGETTVVAIAIRVPSAPGRYRLAIDLVREGVTWFSQAGRPWLEVTFDVRKP